MGLESAALAGPDEAFLLARFGIGSDALLGAGGESRVFALDEHRVLRIQHGRHDGHHERLDALLAAFAAAADGVLDIPQVLERGASPQQAWSIERRVAGVSLDAFLAVAPAGDRRAALLSALDAAAALRRLPLPDEGFRQLFGDHHHYADTLAELLDVQMDLGERYGKGVLARELGDHGEQRERMRALLARRAVAPAFCHVDLAPGNMMVTREESGAPVVSGVIDFSAHALAADPVLDEVGVVVMARGFPGAAADSRWLEERLAERLVAESWLIDVYRRFYASYYAMDPALHEWCLAAYRTPLRWV